MIISGVKPSPANEVKEAGAIITVETARRYIRDYRDRMEDTEVAFTASPVKPWPFDPNQESPGWMFDKKLLLDFINNSTTDDFVAILFGVGPRTVDNDGKPQDQTPVLHVMMTSAKKMQDGTFLISSLAKERKGSDEFGVEQGSSCCNKSLRECIEPLETQGIITDLLPAVAA